MDVQLVAAVRDVLFGAAADPVGLVALFAVAEEGGAGEEAVGGGGEGAEGEQAEAG